MQLGIIGLGRMGGNISRRLMRAGHTTVVYDRNTDAVGALAKDGASAVGGLAEMVKQLQTPRAVWVMLPSGKITEDTVTELAGMMEKGDIIIDGGNSNYKDDIRRAATLREKGLIYVDVGTSGGVYGLERGYCMMIGGETDAVKHLDPIFKALAPGIGNIERTPGREKLDPRAEQGYIHAGPAGAGHFVKMIHNGIEYGMMQAYAEGFDILHHKMSEELPENERFTLDVTDIAEVWRRGSVVSSWLLDLTALALTENATLSNYEGGVADSGEGRWTIEAAIEEAVPVSGAVGVVVRAVPEPAGAYVLRTSCCRRCGRSSAVMPRPRSKVADRWTSTCRCRIGSPGTEGMEVAPKAPPCTMVIFGGGRSDAAAVDAVDLQSADGRVCWTSSSAIIAVDRNETDTEAYRARVTEAMESFAANRGVEGKGLDNELWGWVCSRIEYHRGDLEDNATYDFAEFADHGERDLLFGGGGAVLRAGGRASGGIGADEGGETGASAGSWWRSRSGIIWRARRR